MCATSFTPSTRRNSYEHQNRITPYCEGTAFGHGSTKPETSRDVFRSAVCVSERLPRRRSRRQFLRCIVVAKKIKDARNQNEIRTPNQRKTTTKRTCDQDESQQTTTNKQPNKNKTSTRDHHKRESRTMTGCGGRLGGAGC
jgi:hypothetical protein